MPTYRVTSTDLDGNIAGVEDVECLCLETDVVGATFLDRGLKLWVSKSRTARIELLDDDG